MTLRLIESEADNPLFRARRLTFDWKSVAGIVRVDVLLPDFSQNQVQSSGDWATEYRVQLRAGQSIRILYRNQNDEEVQESRLQPDYLMIRSPILAEERRLTPWFYEILDEERMVSMELYLASDTRLAGAKLKWNQSLVTAYTEIPRLRVVN